MHMHMRTDGSLRLRLAALHESSAPASAPAADADSSASASARSVSTATSASASACVSVDSLSVDLSREFEQALLVLLQLIGKQKYPHAAVTVMYANVGRVTMDSKVVIRHPDYQRRYVNFSMLGTGTYVCICYMFVS